jgi:transcriptional regulator
MKRWLEAEAMYVPPAFAEDRLPVLHAAIRRTSLATLVTTGPDGLLATPLPLLLDAAAGPYGTLYGHLARANPQWQRSDAVPEALALFMGPDGYVTPSWYATKRESGKVVPTWNYVTVHAYGKVEFFEDAAELLDAVTRLTARHEAGRAAPWTPDDAPPEFIQGQLKGIVGMRIAITRLQGKWKLSQNRGAADRAGVVAGLRAEGDPGLADLIAGPPG